MTGYRSGLSRRLGRLRSLRGSAFLLGGFAFGRLLLELRLVEHFTLEDPHLDADDAISGAGLGEPVVDVGAERVQRDASLAIPLRARDLRAVQAAGDAYLHTERAAAHGAHDRALHRTAEHHALLDLLRDAIGHQLSIELGLADLGDVQPHVIHRHAEQLRRLQAQLLDVLALLADHDARAGSLNGDVDLLGGALEVNAAHRGFREFGAEEVAHPEVRVHVLRKLLPARKPLGGPVASDTEAYAQRIDLLAHA